MTPDDPIARAAADVTGLYTRHADLWDRVRGPDLRLEAGWMGRFAALLPPGSRVLDLGCGTGRPLGAWLLAQGFAVTGVDASAPAIDRARERLPAGTWICADMRSLDLGDTFDGLLAWDSLFHLTPADQQALFRGLGARAAPGAALMFTSGPDAGTAMGEFGGDPLHHASLSPDAYRRLLAAEGFDVLDFAPEDPDCGGHSVWLARRRLG
ncbi:class I SAM-dependent methyltransferase [Phenylobacterium sp.]|uniref:class I SAM-dependent DNA methyltransferase n=1 Tax=Phenylobacterium sp. TaxID=1871053 RepID=UPI0025ED85BA|nr:class I SAM-dependent methyltransferase [Phenylobacterium sp.]